MQRERRLQMTGPSGPRPGGSFRPWPKETPYPDPGACKAERQWEARGWRRVRVALELLILLPRLSPWALATEKFRGAGAGLVPLCSPNPVCGSPFGRGQIGLPELRPSARGSRVGSRVLVPRPPAPRSRSPGICSRLFHPELRIKPSKRLWLLAREQRPPGASRARDAGASPGRSGARGL